MLKTGVFVWFTVNCKSLNFCSVDTLSAQLHCHMDYFIYWRHASSTHLPYSSFARNFEFSNLVIRILRSTKSQNFTILLFSNFTQQKIVCVCVCGEWGGVGGGCMGPPGSPQVCRPWRAIERFYKNSNVLSQINECQNSGSCLEEFTKEQKVIFLLFTQELDYLAIQLQLATQQKIVKYMLFALCRNDVNTSIQWGAPNKPEAYLEPS